MGPRGVPPRFWRRLWGLRLFLLLASGGGYAARGPAAMSISLSAVRFIGALVFRTGSAAASRLRWGARAHSCDGTDGEGWSPKFVAVSG
jgi:hypothetical protein